MGMGRGINNERVRMCKGTEVSGSKAPSGNLAEVTVVGAQRVSMKVAQGKARRVGKGQNMLGLMWYRVDICGAKSNGRRFYIVRL